MWEGGQQRGVVLVVCRMWGTCPTVALNTQRAEIVSFWGVLQPLIFTCVGPTYACGTHFTLAQYLLKVSILALNMIMPLTLTRSSTPSHVLLLLMRKQKRSSSGR
jgi:hypothetical protein